jgi:hypothetical protein
VDSTSNGITTWWFQQFNRNGLSPVILLCFGGSKQCDFDSEDKKIRRSR